MPPATRASEIMRDYKKNQEEQKQHKIEVKENEAI